MYSPSFVRPRDHRGCPVASRTAHRPFPGHYRRKKGASQRWNLATRICARQSGHSIFHSRSSGPNVVKWNPSTSVGREETRPSLPFGNSNRWTISRDDDSTSPCTVTPHSGEQRPTTFILIGTNQRWERGTSLSPSLFLGDRMICHEGEGQETACARSEATKLAGSVSCPRSRRAESPEDTEGGGARRARLPHQI